VDEFARPVTLEMASSSTGPRRSGAQRGDHRLLRKNAERFLAPQHLEPARAKQWSKHPVGRALASSLELSLLQLARFAAPPDGGQCRHGETRGCVPQCAIAFEKLWLEAGAPAARYNLRSRMTSERVIDDAGSKAWR